MGAGTGLLAAILAAAFFAAVLFARALASRRRARRGGVARRPIPAPILVEAPPRLDATTPPARHHSPLVNVAAVLSEALDGAALPAGVSVVRTRPRHAAFADADAPLLRDALRMLLRAAAEAMPAGGELRVSLLRQGTHVVVEVADSGAPLAASDALARAADLLGRCGGRLARGAVPGRGNRSRVVLPAPAPPPLGRGDRARAALERRPPGH
jgi:signal transduction histidine kinase